MSNSFTFKIGGEAGAGIMTTGLIFSKVLTRSGFHIFNYTEYPSLIRGGHNVMETHFSQDEVFSQEKGVDLLVALNRETVDLHKAELKDNGGAIFDPGQFRVAQEEFSNKKINLFPVPLKKIIEEIGAEKIMENNIALGASVALFNFDLKILFSVIEDIFSAKSKEVAIENQKAAEAGYEYIKENFKNLNDIYHVSNNSRGKEKLVITGNEAIGLGAIAAGCRFYAAYPMTPASSILHYLAGKAEEVGMIVRHAEDEIGVINEAIGASFAGARAMVGTSGGGFALMTEAVALAGITETPIVIVVAQRPGPATGMPTWTEQGDLQFIIRSGHGEFPKIVLAPGDVVEAFQLTKEAFSLADIYQTPVIVVSDKYLSESHKGIDIKILRYYDIKAERRKLNRVEPSTRSPKGGFNPSQGSIKPHPRYKVTEDGISPRVLPGTRGFYYQANSYEHLEDGHTTEEAKARREQVEKRNRKALTYLKNHFKMPKLYGSKNAQVTLVGWGSVKGPILQAIHELRITTPNQSKLGSGQDYELRINFLHFTHLWPMNGEKVKEELEKYKKLVLVENNSTGQFGQLLRQETGIEIKDKLLKYDGRPFYPEEILDRIR